MCIRYLPSSSHTSSKNCISRKEDYVALTSIVLAIVSLAVILMSVAFAVASRALYMERRKNIELSKKLAQPPRIEVLKLAETSPGYIAEYDIRVDGNVTQTIRIPKDWLEHDRLSL